MLHNKSGVFFFLHIVQAEVLTDRKPALENESPLHPIGNGASV